MEENNQKENNQNNQTKTPPEPAMQDSGAEKYSYTPVDREPTVVKTKVKSDYRMRILVALVALTLIISIVNVIGTSNVFLRLEGLAVSNTGTNQPGQPNNNPAANSIQNLKADGNPVLGSADAKVTMIEYSDFQCPYCARFATTTHSQIIREYVDTGKVKMEFRNLPLGFHEFAQKAAEASECAYQQGKFWEFYEKAFKASSLSVDSLKQIAKDIGLDTAKFNACLDSGSMAAEVDKDKAQATKDGIRGTPGFIINGEVVSGAQPFEKFKEVIDRALAKV